MLNINGILYWRTTEGSWVRYSPLTGEEVKCESCLPERELHTGFPGFNYSGSMLFFRNNLVFQSSVNDPITRITALQGHLLCFHTKRYTYIINYILKISHRWIGQAVLVGDRIWFKSALTFRSLDIQDAIEKFNYGIMREIHELV